jgi:hypothetical protein
MPASALVRASTPFELRQDVLDGNPAADGVAVEAPGDVFSRVVVDAQDRVAAVGLAALLVGLSPIESIDEDGDECRAGGDDAWIAERTAREVLATLSARVLAEVHPEGLVLFAGDREGGVVVDVPRDVADRHSLRDGTGARTLCGVSFHLAS